jgi:pimeloyl-ACP methyl ester carboxylesterase
VRELVRAMQLRAFQIPIPDDAQEIKPVPPAIERLGDVQTPALVVAGVLDLEEKVTLAERVAREMPNARYAVMTEAAHMLTIEQPDEFNRLVLSFLTSFHPS